MKFEQLLERLGDQPMFDFAMVCTLFGEKKETVRTALSRLKRAGKILELKRGLYTFAEPYRRATLNAAYIANMLYAPSYLSERWALSWYSVIPEKTAWYTSITTRPTRTFENRFGVFRYRTIKPSLFDSYRIETILSQELRVATPEKALLDLWYLEGGEWTAARMESFRFEPKAIDTALVIDFARASKIPRLIRAAKYWQTYADSVSGAVLL